jgi:hypothetical protein
MGVIAVALIVMIPSGSGTSSQDPVYIQPTSSYVEPTVYIQPTTYVQPTVYVEPTVYVPPTIVPSSTTPPTCPGAEYPPRLQENSEVVVCTKYERVIVRKSTSMGAAEILWLYPGTKIRVTKGPICSETYWWWKVEVYPNTKYGYIDGRLDLFRFTTSTVYGWAREGWDDEDTYFICPIPQ